MNKFILIIALLSIAFLNHATSSETSKSVDKRMFKPRDFSTFKNVWPGENKDEIHLQPGLPRFVTTASFTGKERPLAKDTKEVFKLLKARFPGVNFGVLDTFHSELEFEQENEKYWLPVKGVLANLVKIEGADKNPLRLYSRALANANGRMTFIVLEFEKLNTKL